jgi:hypothetical protein
LKGWLRVGKIVGNFAMEIVDMELNQELVMATRTGLEPVQDRPASILHPELVEIPRGIEKDKGQSADAKERPLVRKLVKPDLAAIIARDMERILERIAAHLITSGGCWEYQGLITGGGYPGFNCDLIGNGRRVVYLHRLSYALFHGSDPGDLLIRHKCDNPKCINPDHLETGTHADNARDRADHRFKQAAAKYWAERAPVNNPKLALSDHSDPATLYAERREQAWTRVLLAYKKYAKRRAECTVSAAEAM